MSQSSVTSPTSEPPASHVRVPNPGTTSRRDLLLWSSRIMAALLGLLVLIPGVGYVLTPLIRSRGSSGGFTPIGRFGDLEEGVPKSFPVVEPRQDAWVRYPDEPVGMVWLVRQPKGSPEPVVALSAECPHLACAITLSPDKATFFCPCHTSAFSLKGDRLNKVPPRGMDRLEIEPFDPEDPDAVVRVKFLRFRTMTEEQIPLA